MNKKSNELQHLRQNWPLTKLFSFLFKGRSRQIRGLKRELQTSNGITSDKIVKTSDFECNNLKLKIEKNFVKESQHLHDKEMASLDNLNLALVYGISKVHTKLLHILKLKLRNNE